MVRVRVESAKSNKSIMHSEAEVAQSLIVLSASSGLAARGLYTLRDSIWLKPKEVLGDSYPGSLKYGGGNLNHLLTFDIRWWFNMLLVVLKRERWAERLHCRPSRTCTVVVTCMGLPRRRQERGSGVAGKLRRTVHPLLHALHEGRMDGGIAVLLTCREITMHSLFAVRYNKTAHPSMQPTILLQPTNGQWALLLVSEFCRAD